jgi:hypothetical protein
MARKVKVFIVDPKNPLAEPVAENTAREVPQSDVDSMLSRARGIVEKDGLRIRSIGVSTDGSIVVYAAKVALEKPLPGAKPAPKKEAKPLPGWVYKRPSVPSKT